MRTCQGILAAGTGERITFVPGYGETSAAWCNGLAARASSRPASDPGVELAPSPPGTLGRPAPVSPISAMQHKRKACDLRTRAVLWLHLHFINQTPMHETCIVNHYIALVCNTSAVQYTTRMYSYSAREVRELISVHSFFSWLSTLYMPLIMSFVCSSCNRTDRSQVLLLHTQLHVHSTGESELRIAIAVQSSLMEARTRFRLEKATSPAATCESARRRAPPSPADCRGAASASPSGRFSWILFR